MEAGVYIQASKKSPSPSKILPRFLFPSFFSSSITSNFSLFFNLDKTKFPPPWGGEWPEYISLEGGKEKEREPFIKIAK